MLSKIDGITSRLLFSVAKWSLLMFFALAGLVALYEVYSDIFTDGWGLSSLSKFELVFLVASFLLVKRLFKKTSQVGAKIHATLLNLFVYSGIILVISMAVILVFMIMAIAEGKNTNELIVEFFLFGYEGELLNMLSVLLVLYISAPMAMAYKDISGSNEENSIQPSTNNVKNKPVNEPEQDSKFTDKGQDINATTDGVSNA